MLRFSRGESSKAPKPQVADGPGVRAWLAGLSQPGSAQSLREIEEVLHALGPAGGDGSGALTPQRKFAVAERIRGVLLQVLWERVRDDCFAALPVKEEHAAHIWGAIDATSALRDLYAWLVSQLPDAIDSHDFAIGVDDTAGKPSAAPISRIDALQRALDVNAQIALVIQRARWPVPAATWERHCTLGQLVRDIDCQDIDVGDATRLSGTRTCRAAFALPVMVALADPASKSSTEFDVIRMAAQRWSAKMGFRIERRAASAAAPARPVVNPGPTVTLGDCTVRFDTQSAIASIDKRIAALHAGKSTRDVGIGDALRPAAALELLKALRLRWGAVSPNEIDSPDRAWRAVPSRTQLLAVVAIPRGALSRRDNELSALVSHSRGEDTYAYHRISHAGVTRPRTMVDQDRIDQLLSGAETWSVVAEAGDAYRCTRRHARPRVGLHRLVVFKPGARDEDGPLLVGWVDSLQSLPMTHADDGARRHTDAHTVRIQLAPGMPIIVRASADDVELDFAFLLVPRASGEFSRTKPIPAGSFFPMASEMEFKPDLLERESADGWDGPRRNPLDYALVLPHSTFRPQRLVKAVRDGSLAVLRLEQLVLRGADFDLARFTPL